MSGTVIDVQVFTREGIERDKRAQQIIDDELRRYKTDLADQMRIVERDTFARIERLLVGKIANKGPKKLAKGTKLTKAYLESIDPHHWFDIGLASDETAQQLENLRESIEQTRKDFDVSFVGDLAGKLERQEYIGYALNCGVRVETFGTGSKNGPLPLVKMVEVFNRTKVNLNFTRISRRNALRSEPSINYRLRQVKGRIAEIALSGGFVLTEFVPGIEEAFMPGKEVDIFDSREELVAKIRYYLSHDDERAAIARAGHERASMDYDVMKAIPRLVSLIDEKRREKRLRINEIYTDSHFERYYATFRVRLLARFIPSGKWRFALEEIETILKTRRIDARKAVGLFVFSVFPNLKSIYLHLRNADKY